MGLDSVGRGSPRAAFYDSVRQVERKCSSKYLSERMTDVGQRLQQQRLKGFNMAQR